MSVSGTGEVYLDDSGRSISDESLEHKKMVKLTRRVKKAEKKMKLYLHDIEKISEEKLAKRYHMISQESLLEDKYALQKAQKNEMQNKYIVDVDAAMEKQAKIRSLKLYHKTQIKIFLPGWIQTIEEIYDICKVMGHDPRKRWRSKVLAVMKQVSKEMADDPLAYTVQLKLNHLILEINLYPANEIIRLLEELKQEYVKDTANHAGTEGHSLGHHSLQLEEINKQIHTTIVPLPKEHWSPSLARRKDYMNTSTTSLSQSSWSNSQNLNSFNDTCNNSTSELFEADFQNRKSPMVPPHTSLFTQSQCRDLIRIRAASVDGDFDLAWEICHRSYFSKVCSSSSATKSDNHSISKDSMTSRAVWGRNGRQLPVPYELFLLLMRSFKNSKLQDFQQAYLVLDALDYFGYKPDVHIFNIMLKACVRESRWRRCLLILRDMERVNNVLPNTHSFLILVDCCRHALDEAGVIFETLRREGIQRSFCYKAALCNNENRISSQVVSEAILDVTRTIPGSVFRSPWPGKTYGEGRTVPVKHLQSTRSKLRAIRDVVVNTLPAQSPAKLVHGLSSESFNLQLARTMAYSLEEREAQLLSVNTSTTTNDVFKLMSDESIISNNDSRGTYQNQQQQQEQLLSTNKSTISSRLDGYMLEVEEDIEEAEGGGSDRNLSFLSTTKQSPHNNTDRKGHSRCGGASSPLRSRQRSGFFSVGSDRNVFSTSSFGDSPKSPSSPTKSKMRSMSSTRSLLSPTSPLPPVTETIKDENTSISKLSTATSIETKFLLEHSKIHPSASTISSYDIKSKISNATIVTRDSIQPSLSIHFNKPLQKSTDILKYRALPAI